MHVDVLKHRTNWTKKQCKGELLFFLTHTLKHCSIFSTEHRTGMEDRTIRKSLLPSETITLTIKY